MDLPECLFLTLHVGDHVAVSGLDVLMAKPYRNGQYVHAGFEHVHGIRMPEDVRLDLLALQSWMLNLCLFDDCVDPTARTASGEMVSIEGFMDEVKEYIEWYNSTRIKRLLGSMTPLKYRRSLGLAAWTVGMEKRHHPPR